MTITSILSVFSAFILGCTLPCILVTYFIKSTRSWNVYFPIVSAICFGGALFLYQAHEPQVFYGLLAVVTISITTWLSLITASTCQVSFVISRTLFFLLLVTLLGTYYFFPNEKLYWYWCALISITISFQGFYLHKMRKQSSTHFNAYSVLFLLLLFSNFMFTLWVSKPFNVVELLLGVVSFSLTLLLAFWVAFMHSGLSTSFGLNALSKLKDDFSYAPDSVTNLPRGQQATQALQNTLEACSDARYAVIAFKPVNFAQVNTVLGHHNSDILLLQFAYGLQKTVANHSHLVNFNGDEEPIRIARLQGVNFLVVLNVSAVSHSDTSLVTELCDLLRKSIPQAMSFKSYSLNFELAFGVSISGKDADTSRELINHAEDALIYGEENHIKINFFDVNFSLYNQEQLLKMEQLKSDIDNGKLDFCIQPQVNLTTKAITGFELKTQWLQQNQGLDLDEFIVLAECSGDIFRLTQIMLEQAFDAIEQLKAFGLENKVSISLPSKMLFETDIVDFIEQKLNEHQVKGEQLVLELSESTLQGADEHTMRFIDQVKALSVGISIRNFSGSYDALKYLRKLSLNQVKIDCDLLADSDQSATDKAIINALINLCRTMGVPIVGHNIHSSMNAKTYMGMGGEVVQGEVISSGIALNELSVWLKNWNKLYQH